MLNLSKVLFLSSVFKNPKYVRNLSQGMWKDIYTLSKIGSALIEKQGAWCLKLSDFPVLKKSVSWFISFCHLNYIVIKKKKKEEDGDIDRSNMSFLMKPVVGRERFSLESKWFLLHAVKALLLTPFHVHIND